MAFLGKSSRRKIIIHRVDSDDDEKKGVRHMLFTRTELPPRL